MNKFYRGKRTRNLFDPNSESQFKISRSKLELFVNCPRCFYFDRRLGIGHPPGYPFNLNSAVDLLLKKEFDQYRLSQAAHPLFEKYNIDAIPFKHEKLEEWRDSLHRGLQAEIPGTSILLTGGLDDIWECRNSGKLHVVDYKATSKSGEITLSAEWQNSYKRQAEVYQWLLAANGFPVAEECYFVYCNAIRDRACFDSRLDFEITIISHIGSYDWVEDAARRAYECLMSDDSPALSEDCAHCMYFRLVHEA